MVKPSRMRQSGKLSARMVPTPCTTKVCQARTPQGHAALCVTLCVWQTYFRITGRDTGCGAA